MGRRLLMAWDPNPHYRIASEKQACPVSYLRLEPGKHIFSYLRWRGERHLKNVRTKNKKKQETHIHLHRMWIRMIIFFLVRQLPEKFAQAETPRTALHPGTASVLTDPAKEDGGGTCADNRNKCTGMDHKSCEDGRKCWHRISLEHGTCNRVFMKTNILLLRRKKKYWKGSKLILCSPN